MISDQLKEHKLVTPNSRIVVEKPLGRDLASALALNDQIGNDFGEDQIFRIDHYLGKETVQNLMALRFANTLFEPLWNSAHIDHVQITVAETVGAGRPRDLLRQGRRAARHGAEPHAAAALPRRHGAAALDGRQCAARREAEGAALAEADQRRAKRRSRPCAASTAPAPRPAAPSRAISRNWDAKDSNTETFVALKAEIANWRWAGVPFYLRTGKRLADAGVGDRHPVQADPALDLRRQPPARRSPTSWSSACSPTRASSCA